MRSGLASDEEPTQSELTKFVKFMESAKIIAASALLAATLAAIYEYLALMGVADVSPARIVLIGAWIFGSLFIWELSRIIEWYSKRKSLLVGIMAMVLAVALAGLDHWTIAWRLSHPPEIAQLTEAVQGIGSTIRELTDKTITPHIEDNVVKEIQAVPGYLKLDFRNEHVPMEQVGSTASVDVVYANNGSTYVHDATMDAKLFYVDFKGVRAPTTQDEQMKKTLTNALEKDPPSGSEDVAPGAALWSSLHTPSVLTPDMFNDIQAGTARIYFVGKAQWKTQGVADSASACVWLQPSSWVKVDKPVWHVC